MSRFKTFEEAVTHLQQDQWTSSGVDFRMFFKAGRKAKIKSDGGSYKIVYSKKRTK